MLEKTLAPRTHVRTGAADWLAPRCYARWDGAAAQLQRQPQARAFDPHDATAGHVRMSSIVPPVSSTPRRCSRT